MPIWQHHRSELPARMANELHAPPAHLYAARCDDSGGAPTWKRMAKLFAFETAMEIASRDLYRRGYEDSTSHMERYFRYMPLIIVGRARTRSRASSSPRS